jgi:hypothetical protein
MCALCTVSLNAVPVHLTPQLVSDWPSCSLLFSAEQSPPRTRPSPFEPQMHSVPLSPCLGGTELGAL